MSCMKLFLTAIAALSDGSLRCYHGPAISNAMKKLLLAGVAALSVLGVSAAHATGPQMPPRMSALLY